MRPFKTQFITFYSYKGGVGRTSALVNSALLRAISGDRVVIIDFDLEAPGVSSYIKGLLKDKDYELDKREGILEYLSGAIKSNHIPTLSPMALTEKDFDIKVEGKIWFIGAGNTSSMEYSQTLTSLNWTEIFAENNGRLILENFKRQIEKEFDGPDYVFIDSRTGITEIGGVCTRYLADEVVILSSLNNQNVIGTSKVVKSFEKATIPTILVASNVPVGLPWGNNQLFSDRVKTFEDHFGRSPDLLIYHHPSLSLTEYLPAKFKLDSEKAVLAEDPLLKSYENLSRTIDKKNPNSFKKSLMDFAREFFATHLQDKYSELEKWMAYYKQHFSHRRDFLSFIKNFIDYEIEKKHNKPGSPLIEKLIPYIKKVNDFKPSEDFIILDFMANTFMVKTSEELIEVFDSNPKETDGFKKFFPFINPGYHKQAVNSLMEKKEFEFIIRHSKRNNSSSYMLFAKGFAYSKLGRKSLAIKYYDKYSADLEKEVKLDLINIKDPEHAFIMAYIFHEKGEKEMARLYSKKAGELVASSNRDTSLFVPTLFKFEDKKTFNHELDKFSSLLSS